MSSNEPILFTPGPVRMPPSVAHNLANPPCNYHRQDAFCAMFAETVARLKALVGLRDGAPYDVALVTATGTGTNEAALLALARLGRGAVATNGFFGARAAAQARANGLDCAIIDLPDDRPIDAGALAARLDAAGGVRWLFYVSHETRVGMVNPMRDIGQVCRERGLAVGVDVISSAYAYPIDLEAAGAAIAIASSAKALMAAPGIGIAFVHRDAADALRAAPPARGYYLDLIAELDRQRADGQPRFAQPVALHAALHAACAHLEQVGIDAHMARIQRQLDRVRAHLERLGAPAMLDPRYRSGVVLNFRLPAGLGYPELSRRLLEAGYFVLYGIPGDDSHFQVSTIGHLDDAHVDGLCDALSRALSRDDRAAAGR